MYSISTGIVDNDPLGTSGFGTRFWMRLTVDGVVEHIEWSLLEQLNGIFSPSDAMASLKQSMIEQSNAIKQSAIDAKNEAIKARSEIEDVDQDLITLVVHACRGNPMAVGHYLSGNDKAINSIVGWVMMSIKKCGMKPVDALKIKALIDKQLGNE